MPVCIVRKALRDRNARRVSIKSWKGRPFIICWTCVSLFNLEVERKVEREGKTRRRTTVAVVTQKRVRWVQWHPPSDRNNFLLIINFCQGWWRWRLLSIQSLVLVRSNTIRHTRTRYYPGRRSGNYFPCLVIEILCVPSIILVDTNIISSPPTHSHIP